MVFYAAVVACLLCILSAVLQGKFGLEKTITACTFPVQAAWLLTTGWLLASLSAGRPTRRERSGMRWPLLLWCVFTICGTPLLGDAGFRYLESLEVAYRPGMDPPLDALMVLGGGTTAGPNRAEAADAGDRVLYAAQLYLQGNAGKLLTSGTPISPSPSATTTALQASEIWTQLGIPPTAIVQLQGVNTYAEIQSLKRLLQRGQTGRRVGLLTSAWHLPRAMRLARAAGLPQLVPVAADHEEHVEPRPLWQWIPSADSLERLERVQRELLARLVAR